ncbi:MAG: HEPN domain-containing protein [Nitrospira sp.]|nr:HEPN domain-containing protein [Nitrospira sp.]
MKTGDTDDVDVVKQMLGKARKKLRTARTNFDNSQYDDAISRAYYAVFHTISAVLLSKGLHFSSHGQIIGAFNREFIKTKKFPASFSKSLKKLFDERQIGDYDFQTYIDEGTAKEGMESAEKIINACEKYLTKTYKVSKDYWKE